MIESDLINDILEISIEGEKYEDQLQNQIELLTIKEEEHTGTGLFVYFEHQDGIEKFRIPSSGKNLDVEGKPTERIEKAELINEHINVQADTCVHLTNGLIDCVEIWNKPGPYPKGELVTYRLKPW